MPVAILRVGLPLGGMNLDIEREQTSIERPGLWAARDIDGFRFEGRKLVPWPAIATFADTANAERVTHLHNVLWGDGTVDAFRHSETGIHRLSGGAWVSIKGALDVDAEAPRYWSSALVPGNTGRGFYLFSTDHRNATPTDQIFFWDGAAANVSNTWTGGTPNPARHITKFADRAFLFNQAVAGTNQSRRGQWSIPGDGTNYAGTGSGSREFGEFEGAINGASELRGDLFVYAENAIIIGRDTFGDPDNPVRYFPVTSNGIGIDRKSVV